MMAGIREFKCPNCDGRIEFDSHTQSMKCPYCDAVISVEDFEAMHLEEEQKEVARAEAKEEKAAKAKGTWEHEDVMLSEEETQGMVTYGCNSCGGEIAGDASMAATSCPFCDSPIVIRGQFKGDLKPDLIIPFKVDRAMAKQKLKDHLNGKPLLPKIFKSENKLEEIKGVYVPFWLYDAALKGEIEFKCTDQGDDDTPDRHYKVIRKGELILDSIPVDGSTVMEDDLMESIEPYNLSEAVEFKSMYLSGFFADRYDVTKEICGKRAVQRMEASLGEEFSRALNYDKTEVKKMNYDVTAGRERYALYPVWLVTTKWNGEKYTFAMNGQTGKFVGNLPVSWGKAAAIYFPAAIGGSVLGTILMMILG